MTHHVHAVVIGGGIVGCSVLYHLTRLGWTDAWLLEKNELTSGSTWHAAGNVTYFGHYPAITRLYVNSIKTYLQAEKDSGHSVGFNRAGSLRLATSLQEHQAYRALTPLYQQLDIDYHVIGVDDIKRLHPLLETDNLHGAAHTPTDGHVDPSRATHALAKAARLEGASIHCQCAAQHIERLPNGEWQIQTKKGRIRTEHVVLATSFWAREFAAQLQLDLPLYALEHHELITDSIPQLAHLDADIPTVRDPAAPSNIRQEGAGLLCGIYESNPQPWAIDGIPADFAGQLLTPDITRLEPHIRRVIRRMPAFGRAGIKVINNGPICYTPDGCPLLGPVNHFPGLWLATGFCIGIGTGGGSGEYLAQWMVHQAPPYDLPIVYPSRFPRPLSRTACLESIVHTYSKGYVTPHHA